MKSSVRDLIEKWKYYWMNQKQNSKEDYHNYFQRAFGVDANMMAHLEKLIEAEISKLTSEIAVARERYGPAGYKIISEVAVLRAENELLRVNGNGLAIKITSLFSFIKHGDEQHQFWLKNAIDEHFIEEITKWRQV